MPVSLRQTVAFRVPAESCVDRELSPEKHVLDRNLSCSSLTQLVSMLIGSNQQTRVGESER
jgi:hypothetical protein